MKNKIKLTAGIKLINKNSKIIEIPNFEACDINTIEDLNEARRLSQKNR